MPHAYPKMYCQSMKATCTPKYESQSCSILAITSQRIISTSFLLNTSQRWRYVPSEFLQTPKSEPPFHSNHKKLMRQRSLRHQRYRTPETDSFQAEFYRVLQKDPSPRFLTSNRTPGNSGESTIPNDAEEPEAQRYWPVATFCRAILPPDNVLCHR